MIHGLWYDHSLLDFLFIQCSNEKGMPKQIKKILINLNGENYVIISLYCSINDIYDIVTKGDYVVWMYINFSCRLPELLSTLLRTLK